MQLRFARRGLTDPNGHELGCVQTTNLFKRCVENVPAAKAAYDAIDPTTRETCAAADPANTLALISCVRFAKTFLADYTAVSFKVSSQSDPIEFHEEAMGAYVEMCETTFRNQITEMNTLYDSLETMGVDQVNIDLFSQNALVEYAEAVEMNLDKICPWDDESLCVGKVCADWGAWPLFTAAEVAKLNAEYTGQFESCAAPQCSYIEDEDMVDLFMKVRAATVRSDRRGWGREERKMRAGTQGSK